jgi:hypothetical protein
MTEDYKKFLGSSVEDQQGVFQEAANGLGVSPLYIEKDFWATFVLEILFNHAGDSNSPKLLFRGGTSLSKAFSLIKRFSEDIDITVSRFDLGFSGDKDPARSDPELSNTRRDKEKSRLQAKCSDYIQNELRPQMISQIKEMVPDLEFEMAEDPEDSGGCSLSFHYPARFDYSDGYVLSRVKIEGGARADFEPNEIRTIEPYIADVIPGLNLKVDNIRTATPHGTFWDKLYILHGQYSRYKGEGYVPSEAHRLSRHHYDVAMIAPTEIGREALINRELREAKRTHRSRMFRRPSEKIEEAIPGAFRLVPEGKLRTAIESDYDEMKKMIVGNPPGFEEIIIQLEDMEKQINSSS